MIGADEQSIVALLLQPRMQRPDDVLVDVFHSADLFVNMSLMRCFVSRLNVDDNEIDIRPRQCCNRRSAADFLCRILGLRLVSNSFFQGGVTDEDMTVRAELRP